MSEPAKNEQVSHRWHWGFVAAGIGMMLVSLVLSALVPVQSDSLYFGNRAVTAIGGALAAGGILGFLDVKMSLFKHGLRGGGGFGVFLVLFFFNPPAQVASAAAPADRQEAIDEITRAARGTSAPGPGIVGRVDLQQVLRERGFSSVSQFRVTASEAEIQEVQRELAQRLR